MDILKLPKNVQPDLRIPVHLAVQNPQLLWHVEKRWRLRTSISIRNLSDWANTAAKGGEEEEQFAKAGPGIARVLQKRTSDFFGGLA